MIAERLDVLARRGARLDDQIARLRAQDDATRQEQAGDVEGARARRAAIAAPLEARERWLSGGRLAATPWSL